VRAFFPKLYILRDDQKLPWDASDDCLVVRLSTKLSEEAWIRMVQQMLPHNQRLSPEEAWQQWWNRPVEREAPPSHRQKP
jgi:hypothetical protein